jgi:2-keto-3-deoxy-6-phosphogluconate aldolase
MTDVSAALRALRIVPVIVLDSPERAVPLRDALTRGGLPCAEITFRTSAAEEAIRRIADGGGDFLVGAGTVLTPQQAARARSAGAAFVVAPGFNPRVVDYCLEHGIPVYPGVATPTEIEAALEKGLRVLKFFPAEPLSSRPWPRPTATSGSSPPEEWTRSTWGRIWLSTAWWPAEAPGWLPGDGSRRGISSACGGKWSGRWRSSGT